MTYKSANEKAVLLNPWRYTVVESSGVAEPRQAGTSPSFNQRSTGRLNLRYTRDRLLAVIDKNSRVPGLKSSYELVRE